MYTTVSKVRELSGLDDTTNISDAVVRGKIQTATSMVDGALTRKYSLPLDYHRQNTLTFSGAGTGSANMTITINAVNYVIAITNGLTAAQAADLFYAAALTNAHFAMEVEDDVVTLISITDSTTVATANAEVNITSAGGTVQGITGTAGTREDRYPRLLDQMVAEIAASLLLMDNYGVEAQDTPKDGDKRMERINKLLLQIQGKDDSLPDFKIIDEVTKAELTSTDGNAPRFYPNDTSDDDDDDPTAPKIWMNQKF